MSELYIGLMSGTSVDGIDAALVDLSRNQPSLIETYYTAYKPELRQKILSLCEPFENEIERLGELDVYLGHLFSETVNELLKKHGLSASSIAAIGSHGQTIRHSPNSSYRFTLQIGDPNTLAVNTGITTIADFRRKDIALGGQGAPLVPAFHQSVFSSNEIDRAIVNIGGIANITLLPKGLDSVIGFDTGPGNVLLDAWNLKNNHTSHDHNGEWGAKGEIDSDLLSQFMSEPYFELKVPKSTGRELFNMTWLIENFKKISKEITAVNIQATLVELTAKTILNSIVKYFSSGEILICGGGANNQFLMQRLTALSKPNFSVTTTAHFGIDPDWVEAVAFAWLAQQRLKHKPGNLPSVTGARLPGILGAIYEAK